MNILEIKKKILTMAMLLSMMPNQLLAGDLKEGKGKILKDDFLLIQMILGTSEAVLAGMLVKHIYKNKTSFNKFEDLFEKTKDLYYAKKERYYHYSRHGKFGLLGFLESAAVIALVTDIGLRIYIWNFTDENPSIFPLGNILHKTIKGITKGHLIAQAIGKFEEDCLSNPDCKIEDSSYDIEY